MTDKVKENYCSICKKTEKELDVPLNKTYTSKYGKTYFHCRTCNTEKCKRYRYKNKEKVAERARAYQKKNRKRISEYCRLRYHRLKNK